MPKRYEDEIRDLLRGMNEFPGEQRRRRRWRFPSLGTGTGRPLAHLDAHRIMGGALILMLSAWILRGPWAVSSPWIIAMAGYISLASIVLFVVALILLVRGGSFSRGLSTTSGETRWRGQVIHLPRQGGPLHALRVWWRRLLSRFTRGGGRPGRRGRDSLQW